MAKTNTTPRKLSRRQDPSHKIMKIRCANGGGGETCPTCGKHVSTPYRSEHKGKTAYGCIDASHTGHLQFSSDKAWHWRQEAIAMRIKSYSFLRNL